VDGAESGETYEVVDPATEQGFAIVPKGGVADARAPWRRPQGLRRRPWPHTLATERSRLLTR